MTGAYREYRVPTSGVDVEVLTADGRAFRGRVFVPDVAANHRGPMRPAEWINEPAPFFPLLAEDGSGLVLLNRHEVLVFTVAAQSDVDLDDPEDSVGTRKRVVVECRDHRYEGEVLIDMPSYQSRLSDFLNRADPFVTVRDGGRHHLIRKARITRVIEPKET